VKDPGCATRSSSDGSSMSRPRSNAGASAHAASPLKRVQPPGRPRLVDSGQPGKTRPLNHRATIRDVRVQRDSSCPSTHRSLPWMLCSWTAFRSARNGSTNPSGPMSSSESPATQTSPVSLRTRHGRTAHGWKGGRGIRRGQRKPVLAGTQARQSPRTCGRISTADLGKRRISQGVHRPVKIIASAQYRSRRSGHPTGSGYMLVKTIKRTFIGIALVALAAVLAGCAYPQGYSDWQWKQYNPNYQPLPGDPQR